MNDYYSQFPQPPLETRINQAIDGIPDYLKSSISTKKLNKIVREVVSNAPEYSLTGYRVSGQVSIPIRLRTSAEDLEFESLNDRRKKKMSVYSRPINVF